MAIDGGEWGREEWNGLRGEGEVVVLDLLIGWTVPLFKFQLWWDGDLVWNRLDN